MPHSLGNAPTPQDDRLSITPTSTPYLTTIRSFSDVLTTTPPSSFTPNISSNVGPYSLPTLQASLLWQYIFSFQPIYLFCCLFLSVVSHIDWEPHSGYINQPMRKTCM